MKGEVVCRGARRTLSRVLRLLREGGFLVEKEGKPTDRWVGPGGRVYHVDLSSEGPRGLSGSVMMVVDEASGVSRYAGRFVISSTGRIVRFPKLPGPVRAKLKQEGLLAR